MKKKKIIMIIIIILLLCSCFICYFLFDENKKTESISDFEQLKETMRSEKRMLLYVTYKNCDVCRDFSTPIVDYYEENYNLKFYKMTVSNTNDLGDFPKMLNFPKRDIMLPFTLFISKGKVDAFANYMINERIFRDYLMDHNYIENNKNDYVIDYEEFKTIYNSDKEQVLFFNDSNPGKLVEDEENIEDKFILDKNDVRGELLRLSKEYNFNYRVVLNASMGIEEIYSTVSSDLGKDYLEAPFIVIMKNGKAVDYLIPGNLSNIEEFIKKHNII